MALSVQCPACKHRWKESTAAAGQRVSCPQCEESVRINRTAASAAVRSANDGPHVARLVLIGGVVILVGVISMLAIRLASISSDEDDTTTTAASVPEPAAEDATQLPTDTLDAVAIPLGTTAEIDDSGEVTLRDPGAAPGTTDPSGNVQAPSQTSADGGSETVPSVISTDRGRELMAGMNDVGLRVVGFSADARGTVANAVRDGVTAAIQQCQLTVRPPTGEPLMVVELQQKNDRLMMSAVLTAMDSDRRVRVWERSGTVTPLDSKATSGGLLPPNLQRDVATFFTGMRREFLDARRQFAR